MADTTKINISIDAQISDDDLRKLQRYPGRVRAVLDRELYEGGKRAHRALRRYPANIRRGHWRANTTPAQRRAFFAKMRAEGKLVSGGVYMRTGQTRQGWRLEKEKSAAGGSMTVWIRNYKPWAPYVQGKRSQARFHRSRWLTEVEAVENEREAIVQGVTKGIKGLT